MFSFNNSLNIGQRKKLAGMFFRNSETVGYLIGQIGKNHTMPAAENPVHLPSILSITYDKIFNIYEQIGGSFIFLDCKADNDKIFNLYAKNGFAHFQDITMESGTTYHQMVHLLHG